MGFTNFEASGEHYQKPLYTLTCQSHTSVESAGWRAHGFSDTEHEGKQDIPRFSAVGSGAFHYDPTSNHLSDLYQGSLN